MFHHKIEYFSFITFFSSREPLPRCIRWSSTSRFCGESALYFLPYVPTHCEQRSSSSFCYIRSVTYVYFVSQVIRKKEKNLYVYQNEPTLSAPVGVQNPLDPAPMSKRPLQRSNSVEISLWQRLQTCPRLRCQALSSLLQSHG